MSVKTPQNQTTKGDYDRFKQLLTQYRARVQETNYLALTKQPVSMEEIIQTKLDKPTILVIEDNTDEWFLIRYGLLRQFPRVDCAWVPTATEVTPYLDQCRKTEKEPPCLILLDLYLPSAQRGMHTLQALKAHSSYRSIPVVVFSRSADPVDIAQVFTYSVNAYVTKPADPRQWPTVFAEFSPYLVKSASQPNRTQS